MSDFLLVQPDPISQNPAAATAAAVTPAQTLATQPDPRLTPLTGGGIGGLANGALDTLASYSPGSLADRLPGPISTITGLGNTRLPRVDVNYQRNMTALTNKYTEMSADFQAVPSHIANAIIDLDSRRVANGQAPLTRAQTLAAIQTATTDTQATPEPSRNPLDVIGNFRADASDILKSIPRLPLALYHEVQDLPKFSERVAEAQAHGANPIAALAQAPGVRMIPGAYTVGNLASGAKGIREAISHPLMTGLDLLPAAHEVAGATEVGRLAEAQMEALGRRPRPISANLTNKAVTDAATGERVLARNQLGLAKDFIQTETKAGQTLDAFFGRQNRLVAGLRGAKQSRYGALLRGMGVAENDVEALLPQAKDIFDRHADTMPFLHDTSPAGEAARAQLYDDIARGRNLSAYDPGFIADYRTMTDTLAHHTAQAEINAFFDNELYPKRIADDLRARQGRRDTAQIHADTRPEYLNPSGNLTADDFHQLTGRAMELPRPADRTRAAQALTHTLSAYGYDVDAARSAITKASRSKDPGLWSQVDSAIRDTIDASPATATVRRGATEVIADLRKVNRHDRQATILEKALAYGKRGDAVRALKNLMDRRPPTFPEAEWPGFREDVVSLARRMEFDERTLGRRVDSRAARLSDQFDKAKAANPPARFDALLQDEFGRRVEKSALAHHERILGRAISTDEAGQIVRATQERRWEAAFPDMDPAERTGFLNGLEADVKATWQQLRAAGEDPIFVHKVSPSRANAAATGDVAPVPLAPSQGKERTFDATPGVKDLQVSLTHQAGELVNAMYREQFIDEVIGAVGKSEADLRVALADTARWREELNPSLGFEAHMQEAIRHGWEKFDPDKSGYSWGGVRLDKYRQDAYYIPKSVAENLHRISKPPSLISQALDPVTKMFRYNVIGLSAGVIVNNFFSNMVAMMAETGPRPLTRFAEAWDLLKHPENITNESLKAMVLAEHPALETMNRDAWLKTHDGQRLLMGLNAGGAFRDSAFAEAARTGKRALDVLAEKSMRLQVLGDNIYRNAIYLDQLDKGLVKGMSRDAAERAAVEQVRRVLVDYNSFTPLERSTIRTIIPFYGYMGHAMRYVLRYPLDHPVRAELAAKFAAAEKERLGALPSSFLGSIPIGKPDSHGNQRMLSLAPFSPFGDISNMFSVTGWMAATNPVISSALETSGLVMGQPDAYPTLRYDPETGRMKPVTGSFLTNLFNNTVPRAGLATAALGLNSQYEAIRAQDPAAASRYLLSAAGLPSSLYRQRNLTQEQVRAEVARQQSASQVKSGALHSGDWSEALRYPSLQGYFDAINTASPEQLSALTPADRETIAAQLRQLTGTPDR